MSEHAIFEPVDHDSLVDTIVAQIEDLIASGILKQGHKLPSERGLAEKLGVSRPKLREALQMLEDRDLVVTRHGEGTFVSQLTGNAMTPALVALYARHGAAFFDYLEYRRAQEAFAARLAAERATKADKARIADLLATIEQAWKNGDGSASREADFQLHAAIVDASQNATLIHIMTSIYDMARQGVFYNRDYLMTIDGSGRQLLDQHLELGHAILENAPDRAEKAALDHIDFVERSFRAGIEQEKREAMAQKRKILSQ
ncbi:MAG: FadR/GntR family transcriptional regulator [Paracoccaceae bacterium]